ncbi:MAG: diguanylate cyclase [Nitrospinae bacterium]|nr:diguanylate cyclase [Nitrospinota bacterium]
MSDDRLLGVMNTYVSHNYQRNEYEENFLNAIAETLAGVIQRRQAEERLKFMAMYDALTGLSNRALFEDIIRQTFASAKRNNERLALMYLTLMVLSQSTIPMDMMLEILF